MSLTVVWQLTSTCDLGCTDCPTATSKPHANWRELTTFEAYKTIDQIAAMKPQRFVMSGGDPLARNDIFELVQYARRRGVDPAVTVSPTRNLTAENVSKLRRNGVTRLVFSLNGSTPEKHDLVTSVPGSFAATCRAMRWAHDSGIAIEVNTLVNRKTVADLGAIAEVIDPFRIDAWNVYFLVPMSASLSTQSITPAQAEGAFAALSAIASLAQYKVRIAEAPAYRRFLMQQAGVDQGSWADFAGFVGSGEVIDEVVFITSDGDVRPSEFLPLSGGNMRERSLKKIVGMSDLFVSLRDRANLGGRCRVCEFRHVCGGSRARAWAMTGDLFASDPLCGYQPKAMEIAV
jgi:radical SAM protein with 4Fe4S-binding SPASM domain